MTHPPYFYFLPQEPPYGHEAHLPPQEEAFFLSLSKPHTASAMSAATAATATTVITHEGIRYAPFRYQTFTFLVSFVDSLYFLMKSI